MILMRKVTLASSILLLSSIILGPQPSGADEKCPKNFYGFSKQSKSSAKCASVNINNVKWPIGATALCKDDSFSFSNNKKSMCQKAGGVRLLRSK